MLDDFKITTYEAPPEGFDPLTAEQSKLAFYGMVLRPEEGTEAYKRWHKVYSGKPKHIIPSFKKGTQSFGPYNANSWSGVVLEGKDGEGDKKNKYKGIEGSWKFFLDPRIRNIQFAPNSGCAVWIGIDGKDASGNHSPLQVGSSFYQTIDGWDQSSLWCSWSKDGTGAYIQNFNVNYGDQLSCVICVQSSNRASIHLSNVTQNIVVDFMVTAKKETYIGNCAEWIVENPNYTINPIANFGSVTFTDCHAYLHSPAGTVPPSVNANTGNVYNMKSLQGSLVHETKTTLTGPNSIEIDYIYPAH